MLRHRGSWANALLLCLCACGGVERAGGPSTADAGPPPTPLGLWHQLVPRLGSNAAELTWQGSPKATEYIVSVGTTSAASDLLEVVIPSTGSTGGYVLQTLPINRTFYARVRARNHSGTSQPSNEVQVVSVDLRDVIDSLFFACGPLMPRDAPGCHRRAWYAFPPNSTVRLLISTTLSPAAREAVRVSAARVETATLGSVRLVPELTADPDPIPGEGEVSITFDPDARMCVTLSGGLGRGCALVQTRNGVILWARGVSAHSSVAGYSHEAIGHGALGTWHLDGFLIGGARQSLMSSGPGVFDCDPPSDACIALWPTPLDIAAAQAVYSAGLPIGARREDFLRLGLVNPQPLGAAGAVVDPRVRRIRLGAEDELLVIQEP